ncbi:MAG: Hsp20/alpha crystallin family protein [Actinobacteria bacterium]|nr:Hsp20/alpha crystallin family protein [Actinomycetota bacterium]MBV8396225.1 Hsp20/alpha crystallin family protein [Actinomycetota bacterium]MBV8599035.1 Hsp20/alpha crystallin family protein [Actinomycetota bacterium]
MATLVRLDPLREVATMHNELSRLMNGLFEGNGRATQSWVPTLDAWETETELVYAFDLPGIPQDKISIEVEDNVLTVSAERELAKEVARESYHRLERRYGTFARSVGLPQGVSDEGIRATFADGVLEVHVPKPEQSKPKRIRIGTPAEQKTIEG